MKSARWSHGNFVINRLFPYGNFCFSELTINSQSSIFLSCLFVPSVLIYLFVHVAVVRNVCISLSCVWQSTVFVFCVNETSILYYMSRNAMYAIYEARGYFLWWVIRITYHYKDQTLSFPIFWKQNENFLLEKNA